MTEGGSDLFDQLHAAAVSARVSAYAPYSGFTVGAAALVFGGAGHGLGVPRIVTGCNVENASYGLTLCAECGVVSELHASGGGELAALVVVGGGAQADPRVVMPCGRCRQLISEHAAASFVLQGPERQYTLEELLPAAFSADEVRPG
ncbi:cytidine deaminase [Leucobacter sp. 1207-22]|uniref:cytidine deaminase n=1 Tax=Leucobacter sp. 1207-22 TaxID=2604456 RepID=UPI00406309FA